MNSVLLAWYMNSDKPSTRSTNTLYRVEVLVVDPAKIVNGFKEHSYLTQLVPEFGELVYKDDYSKWRRNSESVVDNRVYNNLAAKVSKSTPWIGIDWSPVPNETGFYSFHAETILLSSAATHCTLTRESDPDGLCAARRLVIRAEKEQIRIDNNNKRQRSEKPPPRRVIPTRLEL